MEFGRKMMNLLWSPICWPISNWKVAPIWANLNFGAKKKHEHRNKNFKKYYFGVQNDGIWQINDDSMKYVDLFQLKSWTNLSESEFWSQKTKEHRHESLKKKIPFRRPKRWNLAEKRWFYEEVLLVDIFLIEKLH